MNNFMLVRRHVNVIQMIINLNADIYNKIYINTSRNVSFLISAAVNYANIISYIYRIMYDLVGWIFKPYETAENSGNIVNKF